MSISSKLIDARTTEAELEALRAELLAALCVGVDIETQDEDRHDGLNAYNNGKRHVFDHRRTVITGISLYPEGSETAYYINAAHADEENRLALGAVLEILSWINPEAIRVAHNAAFELVMLEQCWQYILENVVCTLQMAVSHHGPDEYEIRRFLDEPLNGFVKIAKAAKMAFSGYDPDTRGRELNSDQAEMLGKFISKTSKAAHSYNGHVDALALGYGLKKLVKSLFGYQMATFEETLKAHGASHMGELTGEQVVDYGADDAYWAVRVFRELEKRMLAENPAALVAFLRTENPMVRHYANMWRDGLRLDLEQVYERQGVERENMATVLRKFKAQIKELLPFPEGKNEKLAEHEDWYEKHWEKKRKQITEWASTPDSEDAYEQCTQASNPIGNAWAEEKGIKLAGGRLNLVHYHGMRTILYDLMGLKIRFSDGKVGSDAEVRGRMMLRAQKEEDKQTEAILTSLQEMAEIEQRMKLYLTPYTQLMDPETSRVYPSISSKLATRRLAASFPNPMQLAKQGNSTYIRSFYLADDDDHLVVSADWSSVELVLIGDFSNDPGFAEVFGQLPYGDLHSGAAADCLAVKTLPGLTEEEFKLFKFGENPNGRILRNTATGAIMEPKAFFKHARGTPVGKGANFNYWYSGSLSTVGGNLGWSSDEMWEAVDRYRARFPLAEKWRVDTQTEVTEFGFVTLPDGHRRARYEATQAWASAMRHKFAEIDASPSLNAYAELAIKRIQSRARNQAVNAMIQGSCATLAKQSILNLTPMLEAAGIADKVRFMMPIHDELVFSVHRDVVMIFIPLLRKAMCTHPNVVKTLPLDCTVSIGKTFRPYNATPFSQWELDEAAPYEDLIPPELQGKKLPDDIVARVVNFLADTKVPANDIGKAKVVA
ncbi:hypothetical protein KNJ79_04930 [Sphingopyxis indica]|uniref:DNA polymerase n=1 Tax=Sphingopyxis indica TaxID=436663 RepID=UPI0029394B86|nr:DNA polymerase [Sphingopyxis indica]WOF44275.1 hypothetical protein KNJ79_04930 [Sphingopyxis indica]